MPFAFPSHQGLIAPLWRRWPGVFDVPGLFIGAAMPDVIDGCIGAYRGYLGQSLGHSLIGLPVLCVPVGVVLWFLAHRMVKRLPAWSRDSFGARVWNAGRTALLETDGEKPNVRYWAWVLFSLGLGAFSHLFFDLISHGECAWFLPWWTPSQMFPDWWHVAWFELPVPGYRKPYPVGPHFMSWLFLGMLGIWILFRPYWRKKVNLSEEMENRWSSTFKGK